MQTKGFAMWKWLQKLEQKRRRSRSFDALLKGSPFLKASDYQDVFALISNDFKTAGFFVEFGAADGQDLSNTWVLEKVFKWRGIVAEPGRNWHSDLTRNRSCCISKECVWSASGQVLSFLECNGPTLSTIRDFAAKDGWDRIGAGYSTYEVNTISLVDLLQKYDAPSTIDFMSVDTEGSELDILTAFDWDRYSINALCVEHNYTAGRQDLFRLLTKHGYKRVYEGISGADDWYVPS